MLLSRLNEVTKTCVANMTEQMKLFFISSLRNVFSSEKNLNP